MTSRGLSYRSLTPFLEESVLAGILGQSHHRPASLVQVMRFVPARDGRLPCLLLNDGDCFVCAYLTSDEAQRSVRDNTLSDSQPEEMDGTPEKGCLLTIKDYRWATKDLLFPPPPGYDGNRPRPIVMCLIIEGAVVNMGGHGTGIVQGLEDVNESTQCQQALMAVRHHIPTIQSNLRRQLPPSPANSQLPIDDDDDDNESDKDDPNGETIHDPPDVDKEGVPLGNVEELLANQPDLDVEDDEMEETAEGDTQTQEEEVPVGNVEDLLQNQPDLVDQILETAEQDEQQQDDEEEELDNDPTQQQQQPNVAAALELEQEEAEEENPDMEPRFHVYTDTGEVAVEITNLQELQDLMANVLGKHGVESVCANSETSSYVTAVAVGEEASTTRKETATNTGDQGKDTTNTTATTTTVRPRIMENPYRKRPQNGDQNGGTRSSRASAPRENNNRKPEAPKLASPIEHLAGTPARDLSQPKGINDMLCPDSDDDSDDEEKNQGDNDKEGNDNGNGDNTEKSPSKRKAAVRDSFLETSSSDSETDGQGNPKHADGKGQGNNNEISNSAEESSPHDDVRTFRREGQVQQNSVALGEQVEAIFNDHDDDDDDDSTQRVPRQDQNRRRDGQQESRGRPQPGDIRPDSPVSAEFSFVQSVSIDELRNRRTAEREVNGVGDRQDPGGGLDNNNNNNDSREGSASGNRRERSLNQNANRNRRIRENGAGSGAASRRHQPDDCEEQSSSRRKRTPARGSRLDKKPSAKRRSPKRSNEGDNNQTKKKRRKQKYAIGQEFWKEFEGHGRKLYRGIVQSYNADKGFYRVRYDDSDEEDLTEYEMTTWLM